MYKKLYDYLDSVLLLGRRRRDEGGGNGGGGVVTPTKRRKGDDETGLRSSAGVSRTPVCTPTKGRRLADGHDGSLSIASTKVLRQVSHHVSGEDIGSPTGTPTKTPARRSAGSARSRPGEASGGSVMDDDELGSVDARKRRELNKRKKQQQDAFRDAIGDKRVGVKMVTEEPPDWTMPAIRRMCAVLDVPRAAPHVYTGVRSVMAFESMKKNGDGSERKIREKAKKVQEDGAKESEEAQLKGYDSDGEEHGDNSAEENGTMAQGRSVGADMSSDRTINSTKKPARQSMSPITFTNDSSNSSNPEIKSHADETADANTNLMALAASLLFYTVARMRGTDTSPEDFIRQRDAAATVLLSDDIMGAIKGSKASNAVNGNAAAKDGEAGRAGVAKIPNDSKNDNVLEDRRVALLSSIERTMRAAQNGWLLLEWYQNIREGSLNTDWDGDEVAEDKDKDDHDDEEGNEDDDMECDSTGGDAADIGNGGRASYYTPQKNRNGLLSGKGRRSQLGGSANTPTRKPGVDGDAWQQQRPDLCSMMMQYQVDYLSEGRKADYVRWKAGIMARVEEIEKIQKAAKA